MITLGSRASELAQKQAVMAKNALLQFDPSLKISIRLIETSGDKDLTSPLFQIGGKGVFIKELELALLSKEIDIAVHSLKDVTSELAPGLELGGFLKREAVSDVAMFRNSELRLKTLRKGSLIGTSSLRRKALLERDYPHLKAKDIRGNVLTRMKKLQAGDYDALLLSEAGLLRLGIEPQESLDPTRFIPAPGQGVIAFEIRKHEPHLSELLEKITDPIAAACTRIELGFLKTIGLDCRSPLGAYAHWQGEEIAFHAFLKPPREPQILEVHLRNSPQRILEETQEVARRWKRLT